MTAAGSGFEGLLNEDIATEKRVFWSELAVTAVMAIALLAWLIVS